MARPKKTDVDNIKKAQLQEKAQAPKEDLWIPSGSTVADLVIGAGRGEGYSAGQMVNIVSESGGGKTAMVNETIANAYKRYKDKCKWVYDATTEGGNTFDTLSLYGIRVVPENPAEEVRSKTVEEAFANIMIFLENLKDDEFGIYALDSLDAITSDEIEDIVDERIEAHKADKEYNKGSYQQSKAKFLSNTFLPTVLWEAEKRNCLIIIISQYRDNVGGGMFAPKNKISSGRALLYYCSFRIVLDTKREIVKNNRPVGAVMKITTRGKARGPQPYREGLFTFYYTYGIDDVGSNVDYLYDLLTPDKGEMRKDRAKALDWDGEVLSRAELIAKIEGEGLEKELAQRVRTKWMQEEAEAVEELSARKRRF